MVMLSACQASTAKVTALRTRMSIWGSQQSPEGPSPATLRAWPGMAGRGTLLHHGMLEEVQCYVYVKCKNKTAIFGQFTLKLLALQA